MKLDQWKQATSKNFRCSIATIYLHWNFYVHWQQFISVVTWFSLQQTLSTSYFWDISNGSVMLFVVTHMILFTKLFNQLFLEVIIQRPAENLFQNGETEYRVYRGPSPLQEAPLELSNISATAMNRHTWSACNKLSAWCQPNC